MEITGEIQDIIYKNETNSYTIAEFDTQEGLTTVVGYLPFVNIGDNLKLIGKFVEHKEYGTQFKIDTFEKIMQQATVALERYLANGNIMMNVWNLQKIQKNKKFHWQNKSWMQGVENCIMRF